MGSLRHFDLANIKQHANIEVFVETGTYTGDSLSYALNHGFESLYSIELLEQYYKLCVNKFQNHKNVNLVHNNSVDGLQNVLQKIQNKKTLFWLDAHLPDFYDSSFQTSNYLNNDTLYIPLREELELIIRQKNVTEDIILIDDLRIYEIGNFGSGNWDGLLKHKEYTQGITFVYDLLSQTHDINKLYEHEGYVTCIPKKRVV